MNKHVVIPMIAGLLAISSVTQAQPYQALPYNAADTGLNYIVPDVACWFDTSTQHATNGYINLTTAAAPADLGNWEPYTGVLGTSTFLVTFNTYANDFALDAQNHVVALQSAAGGPVKLAMAYYTDAGAPFLGQMNLSRQNGNPGRVVGDRRVGGTNYITMSEASLGQISGFMSDNRWTNNDIYQGTDRYAAEQLFSLNTSTLVPTPLAKAWDYVYGPYVGVMGAGNGAPQCSRVGGRAEFLDNGNIVVMIDDKCVISSVPYGGTGEVTTFAIIQPNGTGVKGATMVAPNSIWDCMAAFQGGFSIWAGQSMYFYDNSGTLIASNNWAVSTANLQAAPPNGYGGGNWNLSQSNMRVASDIRSHYVYVSGPVTGVAGGNACMMAVWNGQTGAFITNYMVSSDLDPTQLSVDRTTLAVHEDKVCVTYDGIVQQGAGYANQAIARVMRFDGANLSYLTPSFFVFTNSDNAVTVATNGFPNAFTTLFPNVSMTGDAICIAAKGYINSTNNPYSFLDSPAGNTTLYTVISMPPTLTVTQSGGNATVSWQATAGTNWKLLSSTALTAVGTWAAVSPQPAISGPTNGKYSMTVPLVAANTYFALRHP